ncbi:MAG TPA: TIGR03621 family F420-dependent LLM class oxidoreductase [Ilumatobacter sp.]|nr:TIGR03621 family F420-dependent LLM class oxidoreductase [Ilumatobacter sp.]
MTAADPTAPTPPGRLPRDRPFRFGIQAKPNTTRNDLVDVARRAEALGYATLTMPDHFDDQFAPVPALQCAADATTTLRLGALVFDNDYKHPVVMAKELATMDVLSEGRVEIGLGAGWMESDYVASGIPYDPPGVRVSRFIEGLAVIKGALGNEPFSFAGEHYTITDYNGLPKPVQQLPPVLIGGGAPRVLRFAARHADIVGINGDLRTGKVDAAVINSMSAEAVDQKLEWVTAAAAEAGRLDAIELNVRVFLNAITDDVAGATDFIAQMANQPPEMITESPFALVGPPAKLIDDLLARRERWGFSYVLVGQAELEAFAPVVAALTGT